MARNCYRICTRIYHEFGASNWSVATQTPITVGNQHVVTNQIVTRTSLSAKEP